MKKGRRMPLKWVNVVKGQRDCSDGEIVAYVQAEADSGESDDANPESEPVSHVYKVL